MPIVDTIMQVNDSLPIDTQAVFHVMEDSIDAIPIVVSSVHTLPPTGFVGLAMPQSMGLNPFVTVLLLIMFLMFGYLIVSRRAFLAEMANEFFFIKERSSIFMESSSNQFPLMFSAIGLFVGSFGLFLYALFYDSISFYILDFDGEWVDLLFFLLFAVMFLIVKDIVFHFFGYVFFKGEKARTLYIKSYFIVLFAFGIVLYPIVVGLAYAPYEFREWLIVAGILFAILSIIFILYKTAQIFLSDFRSFLYIILYLCALEILPLLLVVKVLIEPIY